MSRNCCDDRNSTTCRQCPVANKNEDEANDTNINIAVEHENDARTIESELKKFSKFEFPLNVLITYTWEGDETKTAKDVHEEWAIEHKSKWEHS